MVAKCIEGSRSHVRNLNPLWLGQQLERPTVRLPVWCDGDWIFAIDETPIKGVQLPATPMSDPSNNTSDTTVRPASASASAHPHSPPLTPLPSLGSATLPSLGKSVSFVPTVAPKCLQPVRVRQAQDAWQRLQRIERVEILADAAPDQGNQEVEYVISIHVHRSQTRLPANNTNNNSRLTGVLPATPVSTGSALDHQSKRTFSAFQALRDCVWELIRRKIHPVYCELCDGLAVLMCTKLSQPTLLNLTIHRSPAARAKRMRKFVMRVLRELHDKKSLCVPACDGQHELPMLLHDFLFGADHEQSQDQMTAL